MKASLIWHAGTLRLHADDAPVPGPYLWAVTVTREGPQGRTLRLHGVDKAPPRGARQALRRFLVAEGFEDAVWERYSEGRWRTVRVRVN